MVRVKSIEIRWHETQPIFSCDMHPVQPGKFKPKPHPGSSASDVKQWRMATGGGDNKIRMWLVTPTPEAQPTNGTNGAASNSNTPHPSEKSTSKTVPRVEYLATLTRHQGVVNCVRFSPSGDALATVSDDGSILFWTLSDQPITRQFGDDVEDDAYEREFWKLRTMTRITTCAEIYDLAWSPDGRYILVGSTDNLMRIFDVATSACIKEVASHHHYVQGVAWDPQNRYIATQSSDRGMHIYSLVFGGKHGNDVVDATPIHKHDKLELQRSAYEKTSNMRPPPPKRSPSKASDSEKSDQPSPIVGAMDPPRGRTSRQSSIGGSPRLPTSSARSPSPVPPLPASRASSHPETSTSAPPKIKTKQNIKMYGGQECSPFFRRLTWAPDGSLLLTPAGIFEDPFSTEIITQNKNGKTIKKKASAGPQPTVYIYTRGNVTNYPVAHLPGHKTSSVAIRFSPVLYEKRKEAIETIVPASPLLSTEKGTSDEAHLDTDAPVPPSPSLSASKVPAMADGASVFDLPHRMVYAVATHDQAYVYDTQQATPICMFGNLHYAPFTDLSWSADGQTLILASQDGYCSVIAFEEGELGTPLVKQPSRPDPIIITPQVIHAKSAESTSQTTPADTEAPEGQRPSKKKRVELKHVGPIKA